MIHGRRNTYGKGGCRCVECTEAHRLYVTAERRKRGVKPIGPGPIKHGTMHAYARRKCRCDLCREANSLHLAAWRAARRRAS